jgi:hypothetical protein
VTKGSVTGVSPLYEAADPGRGLPGATLSGLLGGESERVITVRTYWFPGSFNEANPESSTRHIGTITLHVEADSPPCCPCNSSVAGTSPREHSQLENAPWPANLDGVFDQAIGGTT